jgi:AcrR family transcriptional regulator
VDLSPRIRQKRRDEILDVAERLIRENGSTSFTMRGLADEAGVSFATPFKRFGSKSECVLALFRRSYDPIWESDDTQPEDPIDAVYEVGERSIEHFSRDHDYYRALLTAILSWQVAEPASLFHQAQRAWHVALENARNAGYVSRTRDAELIAQEIEISWIGSLTAWVWGTLEERAWLWHYRYSTSLTLLGACNDKPKNKLTRSLSAAQKALKEQLPPPKLAQR